MAAPAPAPTFARGPQPLRLAVLAALAALALAAHALSGQIAGLSPPFLAHAAAMAAVAMAGLALLLAFGQLLRQGEAVRRLARRDVRTGLASEAEFRERLEEALSLAKRQGCHVGVLVLDLRGFRAVNETFGRPAGDALLETLGSRLRAILRQEDTVARLGADRFAVVQSALPQPDGAMRLAARLAAEIARPFPLRTQQVECRADIGLSIGPADGAEPGLLLARAEAALAMARARPEAAIICFEPAQDAALRRRRALEAELRDAIAAEQFVLHWQPQRRLSDRGLLGFEALLRWHHPQRGLIAPDEFIPLAEASGLIVPLGTWVLRAACAEAASWPGGLGIAVNLSPAQFHGPGLVATVAEALRASGLPPQLLEIEITESLLQRDLASTAQLLHRLRALGIGIAMDDFGKGYSSLAHLWRLPFTKLKIDRAFLRDLPGNHRVEAIVETTIGLGRALEMTVVAEGVETEAQASWLLDKGCEKGQGWLLGHPMTAAAARAMIAKELREGAGQRSAA